MSIDRPKRETGRFSPPDWRGAFGFQVLLVCLALAQAGCGERADPVLEQRLADYPQSGVKVLMVAIDGATFSIIEPMISQGRLPVLTRLIETGARGPLWSKRPMKSPALWTTVITGKKRDSHGIVDFVRPDEADGEERLFNATDRRDLALWNLMGPFGRTVGFAGWWVSWPAEPVNGWILSDRMLRTRWTEWVAGSQGSRKGAATYPAELAEELGHLVIDPLDPPVAELRELADFSDAELEEMLATKSPIFAHGPSILKFAWSTQRTYERMALEMVGRSQPDLLGILLNATDPASHTFWHHLEPNRFPRTDRETAKRLRPLIPNIYDHNDRYLGSLLERLDSNTVTLVISDHGFRASGKLPQPRTVTELQGLPEGTEDVVAVGQAGSHSTRGVFIASGGPIREGVDLEADLVDIAPTVLALLGMPVPGDMPGRVLEEILEREFLAEYPIRRISSYAELVDRPRLELPDTLEDPEAMEMLRSLGYVQ